MRFVILLFLSLNTQAGVFDFFNIHQANKAYQDGNYQIAGEKFNRIDHDAARLNKANSLYKQELYKQALDAYQKIKQENLAFDRLYNSGNVYAKLGEIDKAISHYESALKLKKDKDALFNIELLKKQNKKNKEQKKDDKKNDENKNKEDKKKEKKASNKQKKNTQKSKEKKQSENKQQQRKKLNAIKQKRWEKSLNKKLRTLMIPLNKQQDNNNEKNPW